MPPSITSGGEVRPLTGGPKAPVSDLDIYAEEHIIEPYGAYQELRDAGPIVWMNRHQAWAVARYENVREVLKDFDTFSSGQGVALNDPLNEVAKGTTLGSDPPEHDEYRDIVAHSLTPRALAQRKAAIEEQADRLVESVVERGSFDAVTDLAQVLPLSVVPDFIGLPQHGRERMLDWASATFNALGPLNERGQASLPAVAEMAQYAAERVGARDLSPGSLGAGLLAAADGGRITVEQCPALLIDYLAPSLDTTISAVASAIWLFATHPDQWDKIKASPELIPNALNEVLRLETPIRGFCRHVTRPTTFHDVTLTKGDPVLVLYASANRDERKWTNPDDFDVTRRCADHVGFGYGIHSCAGQGLARIEAHAVLAALAKRVGRLTLDSSARGINNVIRAFASVRVSVS